MNLAKLSIKSPTFIVCVMLAVLIVGYSSFKSMSVDLFPDVAVPTISVVTVYPGGGPSEIETLISKPLEDNISTISGLKRLSSKSLEGVSQVIAEFNAGEDINRIEQQVRDKVNITRSSFPSEAKEPGIKRFDPSDQPIVRVSFTANMKTSELSDFAENVVKTRLEQVNNVGAIDIYGARQREIHVILDRKKLAERELSVSQVAAQIGASGENIPSGKVNVGFKELSFRGLGEFESVNQISDVLVNLYGNEIPTKVATVGKVIDTLEDEKNRTYVEEAPAIFLYVYRQSGTNTVKVANDVKKAIDKILKEYEKDPRKIDLRITVDASQKIKENVADVYETIIIAILLTILTVYFFLGNFRTTLITGLALPISLMGAFIVMNFAGFSINIVSLLALTLAVGLLVDDAIVIIENIHRRIEMGEKPLLASESGTNEIQLSVFAITLVVISVFVPVAFMSGIVGQFLKQFGLTIAFSMAVSFFVALTLIPMLTAYFTSGHKEKESISKWEKVCTAPVYYFGKFQDWLERVYGAFLKVILKYPLSALVATLLVFALSLVVMGHVPKAFMSEKDDGEVTVTLELAPGTSLDGTENTAKKVFKIVRANPNVDLGTLTVGGTNGEANKADIYIRLKNGKARGGTTTQFKEKVRADLKDFAYANPIVKDFDATGGMALQPFTLNLVGHDPKALEDYIGKFLEFLKKDKRLKDLDTNYRPGKPELSFKLTGSAANTYGINSKTMGAELRAQVEGVTPAKYRENGNEYDVRVRLQEDQRNLKKNFVDVRVPNVNRRLIQLSQIAQAEEVLGPAEINRQDRGRYIQVTAALAPGAGLSDITKDVENYLNNGETKLPSSMKYNWGGDAENMREMMTSAVVAIGFAVIFIYLILSSLYGSFVTPVTILLALPLALCGAFYALYIAHESMNIFAILGVFLLLGVAGKNSILLVDFANQMMRDEGLSRNDAILKAGLTRLRPILMTSFSLIAGTLPVAIGISEASKTRTAMGWTIVGGMISSTLLTLVVVPAIFSYIDRYRVWSKNKAAKIFLPKED